MRRFPSISLTILVSVAVVLVIILVLAGHLFLSPAAPPQQPREVTLVVITRLAPDEGEALRKRFINSSIAREYNIRDVVFLKEDVAKWSIYAEEGRADIFFIGGYSLFRDLCEKGYLKPISEGEILRMVSNLRAEVYRLPNGSICFLAVARTVFSYTVNFEFLEKYGINPPENWGDLISARYSKPLLFGESLISFPKPTKSTTSARTIQMLLQKYGWDAGWILLTVIGANSYIVESSEKARDDVALGISGLAPTVLVYGIRAEELSKGRAAFYPAVGEVLPDISPVAVTKNTRNEREALAFIKWLLSPDGQKALTELFYYLPYIKPEGTPLERLYENLKSNIFSYNPEDAVLWERSALYYFEAAIADPDSNTLLKKTWSLAIELYGRGVLSETELSEVARELGRPLEVSIESTQRTFTKDFAIEINRLVAEDPAFRSRFYDSVKAAALNKYSLVLSKLRSRA